VTTSTRVGLIDDIVISIVVFLVVSLRNTDGTVIQGANSVLDMDEFNAQIKIEEQDATELKARRTVVLETLRG
jgi:cell division protein FtsB